MIVVSSLQDTARLRPNTDRTQNYAGENEIGEITRGWFDNDPDGDIAWLDSASSIVSDNVMYNNAYNHADPASVGTPGDGDYICVFGANWIQDLGNTRNCGYVEDEGPVTWQNDGNQTIMATDETVGGDSGGPYWMWGSNSRILQLGIAEGSTAMSPDTSLATGSSAYSNFTRAYGTTAVISGWNYYYD